MAQQWRDWYESRRVAAAEAVSHVKPGDRIYSAPGQPVLVLVEALLARLEPGQPRIEYTALPGWDMSWYTDEVAEMLHIDVVFGGAYSRQHINDHRAGFTPWWIWGGHKALDENRPGARPLDVAFFGVSPPNENGYCCFGNALWDAKKTALMAGTAIAVVNESIIPTFGDTWIHVSEVDWFVEHTVPRVDSRAAYAAAEPWDLPIAEYVASQINDGDTIQLGLGSTTGNIVRSGVLDSKHDLGYFAELTVPGTVELAMKGVITGRKMNTHPGKFVTTTAGGGPDEVDFIAGNPMFEFYSTDYMHSPIAIAQNENMVAVNNALAIDLTGQVASGQFGRSVWSGTAGQFSYHLGAFMAKGGRAIIILPSTARDGTVSRIKPEFEAGQIVTLTRDIADIVVTEFGIARLLNKNERERTQELVAVAHPDFRAELRKAANRYFPGYPGDVETT
ncbi:MAG: acetyl-CoA hydrolase/transferase family protein [Dehalococcoidia bacterium]